MKWYLYNASNIFTCFFVGKISIPIKSDSGTKEWPCQSTIKTCIKKRKIVTKQVTNIGYNHVIIVSIKNVKNMLTGRFEQERFKNIFW